MRGLRAAGALRATSFAFHHARIEIVALQAVASALCRSFALKTFFALHHAQIEIGALKAVASVLCRSSAPKTWFVFVL